MKINYIYTLIFLENLLISVSSSLIGSEGMNDNTVKYEVIANNNESEDEGKETETIKLSSYEKNSNVSEKQNNLNGSVYNQDGKNGVESDDNKEESKGVDEPSDKNTIIDSNSNQNKETEDENKKYTGVELQEETTHNQEDKEETQKEDKEENSVSKVSSLTIDIIKDVNTESCVVKKLDLNNIPTQVFIPRAGYKLTKLTDGDEIIWESNDNEYIFMTDITLCDDKPCMILIATKAEENEDNRYYIKKDSKWEKASYWWYYLNLVDKVKLTVNDKPYELDIQEQTHENYTFIDCEMDYLHTHFYFNKPGYKIRKVKDGDHVLYNGNGILDTYLNVRVTLSEQKPILIKIEGILPKLTKTKIYQMVDNKWELINEEEYSELINKLRNDRKA